MNVEEVIRKVRESAFGSFALGNIDKQFIEEKSWGWKYRFFQSQFVGFDICFVIAGGRCSWHHHEFKQNRFFVINGLLELKIKINPALPQPKIILLGPNETTAFGEVTARFEHQFKAIEDTVLVEIESVMLREDIIRDQNDLGGLEIT